MNKNQSPSFKKKELVEIGMDFPDAMFQVISGKKITRLEWKDKNAYGCVAGGFLMIRTKDSKLHQWIISDGDLQGKDWVICEGSKERGVN